jgi:hypothetical protein
LKKFGHTTEKDYIALGGPETIPRYDYAANVHHRGFCKAGISVKIMTSVRDDNQSLAQGFSKNTDPRMIEDCERMFRQQFEFAAYDLAQGNIEGCTVVIEKGTIPKEEEDFCMEMEKLQAMHHHAADLAHKIQQVLDKDIQTKGGLKRAAEWGHQLQGITKDQHQILTGARLPLPTHRPEIQRICHMQMDLLKAQYVDQLKKIEELEQKREHKQGEAPWVWRLSQGFATKQRRWTKANTVAELMRQQKNERNLKDEQKVLALLVCGIHALILDEMQAKVEEAQANKDLAFTFEQEGKMGIVWDSSSVGRVKSVREGSQAETLGLQAGDLLVQANDVVLGPDRDAAEFKTVLKTLGARPCVLHVMREGWTAVAG